MADLLTPGERHAYEQAHLLVRRRQAVGPLYVAALLNLIDALVRQLEQQEEVTSARPR